MNFNFEKSSAVCCNEIHIKKFIKAEKKYIQYNDKSFIRRAAIWNYNQFGYGTCSLDEYLEYIKSKAYKRLYNTNVKEWYRLINLVFKRDNYTCSYCGKIGGKLECDHIVPVSKGGTDLIINLTTSCRRCNRQKKDKTVDEFKIWKNRT